jgi:hypothetical protein
MVLDTTNKEHVLYGTSKREIMIICEKNNTKSIKITELKFSEVVQKYNEDQLNEFRLNSKKKWNHKEQTLNRNNKRCLVC